MRPYRRFAGRLSLPAWGGAFLALSLLAGCAGPPAATQEAAAPPPAPGMARVWFLRQADPAGGNVFAADPMVSANGAPLGQIRQGTAFFHDFAPGSYRFGVQSFGTPSPHQGDTIQLAPGMTAYVQIEAAPNWELGSRAGGYGFAVLSMTPQIAKQYLPSLTDLGQR